MATRKNEKAVNSATNSSVTKKPAAPRLHKKAAAPEQDEVTVSQEEIARLAYAFWEARGFQNGSPEEDWLKAEEQLRGRALAAIA